MDQLPTHEHDVGHKYYVTDIMSALLLFAATILVSIQVILRTFFYGSAAWTEELGRYLFVWAVYLGAIAAVLKGTHIRVTFLVEWFGPRAEWWSLLIGRAAGFFAFGTVAWFGWQIAWNKRHVSFYSLPGAPQVLLYLSTPICLSIISAILLIQIVRSLKMER